MYCVLYRSISHQIQILNPNLGQLEQRGQPLHLVGHDGGRVLILRGRHPGRRGGRLVAARPLLALPHLHGKCFFLNFDIVMGLCAIYEIIKLPKIELLIHKDHCS